jgi:hypothetical protein
VLWEDEQENFAAGDCEFSAVVAFVILGVGVYVLVGLAAVGACAGVVEGPLMPCDHSLNGGAGDARVNFWHYQKSGLAKREPIISAERQAVLSLDIKVAHKTYAYNNDIIVTAMQQKNQLKS